MKRLAIGTISAAVVFCLTTGCTPKANVDTGAKNSVQAASSIASTQQDQQLKNIKKFKPNFSKDYNYLKLNIAEIAISPDEVDVGLNYQSITNKKVDWFPEEGHIIIGDMQLNADPLVKTNLVTGEIVPGTKSDGVLVFKPQGDKKIDVSKVDKLKFDLGQIIPADLLGDEVTVQFEIPVKR